MARRTGVEIDGNHVRVAQLNGAGVVFEEFDGATTVDAIGQYVRRFGKPGKDTVVCWSGPSTMRTADIPVAAPSALRSVMLDSASRVFTSTDGMVVSGLVSSDPVAGEQKAMVGAVDVSHLAPVYQRLGEDARVMLSSFAFTEDGTYLSVRSSCVDLVLVEKGQILAARVLKIEGIDQLSADVSRLPKDVALRREKLDDYCDRVVNLVQQTTLQWNRDQRTAATTNVMFIHGVGAEVPGLRERLRRETGKQVLPPPIPGVDLSEMGGVQHRASQALFAATSGASGLPAVWLLDPEVEAAKVLKAEQAKKRAATLAIGVLAAVILVFIALPFVAARARLISAHRNFDSAQKTFDAVRAFDRLGFQVNAGEAETKKLKDPEPSWSRVVAFINANVPPGTVFNTVSFQPEGQTVKVSFNLTNRGLTFEQPEAFLENLIRSLGVPEVFPRNITRNDDGTVTASYEVTLPNDQRFFDSSRTEFPPVAATTTTVRP